MTSVLMKLAPRIPMLLARAAAGDPTAIALLGAAGIAAIGAAIEKNK